jgi:hypothetical protein
MHSTVITKNGKKYRTFTMRMEEYHYYNDQYIGLCLNCGEEHEGCEPDARNYECEFCNQSTVFGVPELLVMELINIVDSSGDAA